MNINYIGFLLITLVLTSCIKLEENEECELSSKVTSYLENSEGNQNSVLDKLNDTIYNGVVNCSRVLDVGMINPFSLEVVDKPIYRYCLDANEFNIYADFNCNSEVLAIVFLDSLINNNHVNYSIQYQGGFSVGEEIMVDSHVYSNTIKLEIPRAEDSMHVYHRFNETEGMFTDTIQTTFPAREAVFCKERGFLYLKDLESGEYILTNFE